MSCKPCSSEKQLRNRITVQQLDATVDARGEINRSLDSNWETYISRNAAFQSLGGSERFASDTMQSGQTHRVWVRSDSQTRAITPNMRMVLGSRKFNILAAVDVNEERQWVRLDVSEDT